MKVQITPDFVKITSAFVLISPHRTSRVTGIRRLSESVDWCATRIRADADSNLDMKILLSGLSTVKIRRARRRASSNCRLAREADGEKEIRRENSPIPEWLLHFRDHAIYR